MVINALGEKIDLDIGKKKTSQGGVSTLNMEVRMAGLALYVCNLQLHMAHAEGTDLVLMFC